jgi:hypothetical protein
MPFTLATGMTVTVREAVIALAGPVAEMYYRPTRLRWEERTLWRKHWGTDLAHARQHVAAAGGTVLPTRPAIILVRRHWREIEAVAAALQERGTLTGREIAMLLIGRVRRPFQDRGDAQVRCVVGRQCHPKCASVR